MKSAKFSDFVKLANFFYMTIGIQPYEELGDSKVKTRLYNLTFFVEIITLNVMLSGIVMFVVMAFVNANNFVEATMAVSYIGFVLVSNIKMLFVWLQKAALTRFINGLKQIFPEKVDLQESYHLQKHLRQSSRITITFSILYMILIWTYNLQAIVKYVICDRLLGWQGIEQALPFIMYIPWDWHQHWSYYILYGVSDFSGYTSAAGQISSDLFLVSCATQLVMHFDYVSREITHYRSAALRKSCSRAEAHKDDMKFLKDIAHYHANLLNLSEQINDIFGVPLLMNFITSSLIICFVAFEITIEASPGTMVKLILFLISSIAQVYMICHYGQELLDASTNVAYAVYNQKWFWTDVRYQKILLLIAQRAQKPVQLKATTFVHVSRSTMSQLLQMSYKFFALLNTMYGN